MKFTLALVDADHETPRAQYQIEPDPENMRSQTQDDPSREVHPFTIHSRKCYDVALLSPGYWGEVRYRTSRLRSIPVGVFFRMLTDDGYFVFAKVIDNVDDFITLHGHEHYDRYESRLGALWFDHLGNRDMYEPRGDAHKSHSSPDFVCKVLRKGFIQEAHSDELLQRAFYELFPLIEPSEKSDQDD